MLKELLPKAIAHHEDLVGVYLSSAVGAIVIRYVASVAHPDIVHVVLAFIALAGFLGAFLLTAKSKAGPEVKDANFIGAAVVAALCFAFVGYLL